MCIESATEKKLKLAIVSSNMWGPTGGHAGYISWMFHRKEADISDVGFTASAYSL